MARGSDNLPRRFAKIYTAAITDVLDELGLTRQTLPSAIQPLTPGMRTAGYAFTARGRPRKGRPSERDATLRQFLKMLGAVPADSVLVLAANDSVAAHFGELSAACGCRSATSWWPTSTASWSSRAASPTRSSGAARSSWARSTRCALRCGGV